MSALVHQAFKGISNAIKILCLFLIRCYQKGISPWLGANCRFRPTCSAYTFEAIEKYGPAKGIYLGMKRILRCRPGVPGGYDPVP